MCFIIENLIIFLLPLNYQCIMRLVHGTPKFHHHQWVTNIHINLIFGCMDTTQKMDSFWGVIVYLPFQLIHVLVQSVHSQLTIFPINNYLIYFQCTVT